MSLAEIYRVFSGKKDFMFGKQPEPIPETDTQVFVMPSSSARCSQLPRAVDKMPYYEALKKLRDHLIGDLPLLDDNDLIFPSALPSAKKSRSGSPDSDPLLDSNPLLDSDPLPPASGNGDLPKQSDDSLPANGSEPRLFESASADKHASPIAKSESAETAELA
uniref:Uncharacterized protein n=1 Tax=Plectus sambesii TaxID=2011161 RepID=A0A914VMR5_9BILA